MHYRKRLTKTCGYAVIYNYGFGEWTACDMPAAKE
jgi:hypothetical protein